MGNATYNQTPTLTDLMTTDLNSLANNTTNVGAVILDNTSNRYFYATFELYLATANLSAETNPAVELYLVPSGDGTNYADTGSDASTTDYPSPVYLVGIFGLQETSAVHRAVIERAVLSSLKYTPVVINASGQAFNAAGSTLKVGTYTDTVA